MESTEFLLHPSGLLTRFGILWKLLPYYGYFDDWKNLLLRLSTKTEAHWIQYKNAYLNVWKYEEFLVMIYSNCFNEEYKNYLCSTDSWADPKQKDWKIKLYPASKIIVTLTNDSSYELFYSYLKEYRKQFFQPEFFKIKLATLPKEISLLNNIFKEL